MFPDKRRRHAFLRSEVRTQRFSGWVGLLVVCPILTGACTPKLPRCEQRAEFLEFSPGECDSLLHLRQSAQFPPGSTAMFRISDTIRRTETVDGGILLDIHHGQMFCLNIVGAKILELMQLGYDESRIAEEISRDYGASREVVRTDVLEFIGTLHKHHILQPVRSADLV